MASNQTPKDLQWLLEAFTSGNLDPHSVSFYVSQPSSYCHQETENSLNVNISRDDITLFSQLLKVLGKDQATLSSLKNLEFHHVQWELRQVKDLTFLLQNSLSINQVVFQRNKFDSQCLSELTETLKINKCLEEITISESTIGSKGAEELSKMIEANSTLKTLTIFDSKPIIATPLISAGNNTLRIYNLDISGACRVACALGWNSTVTSLDLSGVRLKSRWGKEFRWVLEQNRTLREVNLSKTCLKNKGVVYVAAGLFKNQSLQSLYLDGNSFGGVGVEHLLCPLSRFSSLTDADFKRDFNSPRDL